MQTMKALVKSKPQPGLTLEDVPVPEIGINDVLIEILRTGICGTDVHVKHDTFPYWPPVILGHEFAGEVVDVGSGVSGWKVGDRTGRRGFAAAEGPGVRRQIQAALGGNDRTGGKFVLDTAQ